MKILLIMLKNRTKNQKMKDKSEKLWIKYPIIYLLLFCLLAGVAGVETGDIIKNGFPQQKGNSYLKIFSIIINFILSFCFLFTYVKINNKKESHEK